MDVVSYTWSIGLKRQAVQLLDSISIPNAHACFQNEYENVSKFLKRLTDMSSGIRDKSLTASAKRLIEEFLHNMRTETRNKYPTPPTDWSRKTVSCNDRGCGGHCVTLNKFLRDPHQSSYQFKVNEQYRKHIYYALPAGEYLCDTVKDQGTPFTLVVKKTTEGFKKELANWESEVKERRRCLEPLQNDFIKRRLGKRYNELVYLEPTPSLAESSTKAGTKHLLREMRAQAQNTRTVPPVAGVKRKAKDIEVIDLT
jgi:hypothetical protein